MKVTPFGTTHTRPLVITAATSLLLGVTTVASAAVECVYAIDSRTIRDSGDDGIPDVLEAPAPFLWINEDEGEARRAVVEFRIPTSLFFLGDAVVTLPWAPWPNEPVTWYVAPDPDCLLDINDWDPLGFVSTGTFPWPGSGIDRLDVTIPLRNMTAPCFRIGLRMSNSLIGESLYHSHGSETPPELCVEFKDIIFQDGFEIGDTSVWSETLVAP